MDCFALLDDCHASESSPSARLYTGFAGEHRCDDPAALDRVWAQVDRDLRAGLNAVVLADYEWGARLLRAGHEHVAPAAAGCVRFLMFESMRHLAADAVDRWLAECEQRAAEAVGSAAPGAPLPAGVLDLRPSVDRAAFHAAIERIHAAIREGETYQVNYTYRIDFNTFGLPVSLYRRLRARQPVGFGALIALPGAPAGGEGAPENEWVLSCSPELFLRNRGGVLAARPMKGTAPRAQVPEGDSEIARMLGDDAKNRAENLMIVDLLRNDLGRIARTGSVRVPALFAVEAYPTVFQMTSSIEAELLPAVSFAELLRALFPCGSITGAPKHRTMQLISELEHGPRGLYTGAIGWIDRPGDGQGAAACGDFCLSVAIRTLTLAPIEPGRFAGRMGVGAGIVIDSRAEEEFEECLLKARFLTGVDPGFSLFESMFATRAEGIRHFDLHLGRLANSAAALGFALPRDAVAAALGRQVATLPPGAPARIRLTLHKDGRFDIVVAPLEALAAGPVKVLLAAEPVKDRSGLLRHKTTLRHRYDQAIADARRQGAFDMLFFDTDGLLTEGARTNVFLRIDGEWLTPPLNHAVLPGTMRSVLMRDPGWTIREAPLTRVDLEQAERIVVTNALRGVLDAVVEAR